MDLSEIIKTITEEPVKKSYLYDPMIISLDCMLLFLTASKAVRALGNAVEYTIPIETVAGNALFEAIVAKKKASGNVICMPITQAEALKAKLDVNSMTIFMRGVQIAQLKDNAPEYTDYDPETNVLVKSNPLIGYQYQLRMFS